MGTGVLVGGGIGVEVGTGVHVGTGVGVGVGNGVYVGLGVAVGTRVGVAVGGTGVSAGMLVGVADFSLTATVWLESICILAVLPSMLKTGPTHSSTCQPCLGRMSMVTIIPNE